MTNDPWDNQYNTEHVAIWVRSLQAKGLDADAIRAEVDKWTLGDVTQIPVGQHARTIPTDVVRTMVDRALCHEQS
jgi:hypothetical protein